jgi:hypothetical protein
MVSYFPLRLCSQVLLINVYHHLMTKKNKYMNSRWDSTFSENHWSTLETTKQFVHKILLSYLHTQICHLGLQESQKMVWLLDCWSMHKGHGFLDYMKETHPNILVIFIPTNYTNVLQPTIVILQWLLKHAFKVQFNS